MTNDGDATAALLMATQKVSDTYVVPKINQSEHCLSCGALTEQKYCGECGLKNDDLRRSLFRLIGESLGGIFSFESRMWRTWAALLFKPGKVAREYADGARSRYSSPIRVYLVVSFLFFGFLALSHTNLFAVAVKPKVTPQAASEQIPSAETTNDEAKIITPEQILSAERIEAIAEAAVVGDEEALNQNIDGIAADAAGLKNFDFEILFFQPQKKFDSLMDESSAQQFVGTINNQSTLEVDGQQFDVNKALRAFLTNPSEFNESFNDWLPRLMFFMVPMVMFLGVIYIRGPNALLYDHLIHAIYIHSLLFMSLLMAILLARAVPGDLVAQGLLIGFLIYLPLSLKRMFKRGWIKTVWTTLNIGFIYIVVLFFALILMSINALIALAS